MQIALGRCGWLFVTCLWGCGGGGPAYEPTCSDGGATAHRDGGSCVPPGSKGNSKGIGKSCTKGGLECDLFSFAKFCTVDFADDAPAFCTTQCGSDAECGENAVCTSDGSGRYGCTPSACVAADMPKPVIPDAGQHSPDAGLSAECVALARCCAAPGFPAKSLSTCVDGTALSDTWCEALRTGYELLDDCPAQP